MEVKFFRVRNISYSSHELPEKGAGFDSRLGFSPEDVAAHWQQICDFEGAAHPKDNIEALKEMMGNLQKYSM